ncbi:hypothetical protein ACOSQ3_004532 [Xanthoceras sorbifolium]
MFDISNEDHFNEEEAEDQLSFALDIDGEDEVLDETESDEDQLSNAASFDFDNDFMADGTAEDESDGEHKPSKQMRRVPFNVGRNEQIKLEVGQLFQNLQHFRQVIRDFAVHVTPPDPTRLDRPRERYRFPKLFLILFII